MGVTGEVKESNDVSATHHVRDAVRDRVDVLAVRAHHRALLNVDLRRGPGTHVRMSC